MSKNYRNRTARTMVTLKPVRIDFPRPFIPDPAAEIEKLLSSGIAPEALRAGARVAILAGSRKINALPDILASTVRFLKEAGAAPFLLPAMGSHGFGTPEGQLEVLASLGITGESIGAPVAAPGLPRVAGVTGSGFEVWVDEKALEADAIIPVNRIKPHTAFRGRIESGPAKMLAVGLGGSKSAEAAHRQGLAGVIPEAASLLLAAGKVPFGVGVIENCDGKTAGLRLFTPSNWLTGEEEALKEAWRLYPRLPWDELDLLIVERMGKDVSGTGMDINVIGMNRRFPETAATPRIGRVVALSLTEKSLGNATGVGYADIVTKKLADSVDLSATEHNCRASGFPEAARIPKVAADEEEAVKMALDELGNPPNPRIARITDTSNLTQVLVSRALLERFYPTIHPL